MICCPIYHWLEVSREVDISRARSASDIFTDDCPTTSDIFGNKSLVSKILFRFKHTRNDDIRHMYPDVASFHPLHEKNSHYFDCNRGVYMYFVSF